MSNIFDCSGYIDDKYDFIKKYAELDFSGSRTSFKLRFKNRKFTIYKGLKKYKYKFPKNFDDVFRCERNDASILFFVSNSYRYAFQGIEYYLENAFENRRKEIINHLIIPYYFNFRHYVELRLKALYVTLTNKSPKITHDLNQLINNVEVSVNEINYENIDKVYAKVRKKEFLEIKENMIEIIGILKNELKNYLEIEPSVEYYRYIFEKDSKNKKEICLKNPLVRFDFNKTRRLFEDISRNFDELCKEIGQIIYIMYKF